MIITDILNIDGWTVKDGAHASLFSLPSLKTPNSVDWPEEDGVQYDTVGLCLSSKEFTVNYVRCLGCDEANEFETALRSSYALTSVKAGDIQDYNGGTPTALTLDLRVKSITKTYNGELCTMAVVYSMDTPLQGSTLSILPLAPHSSGWTMDGYEMGRWGFVGLETALTSYHIDATTKTPLNYAIATQDGDVYDTAATPTRTANTHTLPMLFRLPISKAWSVLNGFATALRQDGMRVLTDPHGDKRECLYNSASCSSCLIQNGEVWAKFSIVFNS